MNIAELVHVVRANPGSSTTDLASHFGVSERTVRSYVAKANESMGSVAHLELRRKEGYQLVISDEDGLDAWFISQTSSHGSAVPKTHDERVSYLLNDLLVRTDWITLEELSQILYVSKSTLSRDLQEVEERLGEYGLTLEKRPHHGIRVSGDEMDRRMCLANEVILSGSFFSGMLETSTEGAVASEGALKSSGAAFQKDVQSILQTISTCVDEAINESDFQINSASYQNLLVHIGVTVLRVRSGYTLSEPVGEEQQCDLRGSREHEVAKRVADKIFDALGIELPESEVAYIALHLAGKRSVNDAPIENDDAGLVISDEVWGVVGEMLDCVWNVYRFDFRGDLELRMNLARHIVPLSVRMQYHMDLKNPLLSDIRSWYPLAYSMAIDSSTVLVEHYGSVLSDDEIGYIALAFALALERQKTEAPKKNILMVCASGAGSAHLLEYRCRQEFGDYINSITTCDVLNVSSIDFSDIDYVFTTVPIDQELPVPVREVKYFLDTEEVEGVREFLRVNAEEEEHSILGYFHRELFFPHMQQRTKHEALDFLLDRVSEQREVSPNFRELVWKREGSVATSFGNNVAMPHPLEPVTSETFVCVGVLDHPVIWDDLGRTIQVIFLSFFSADAGSELQELYAQLANVLVNKRAIAAIARDQNWETLVGILMTASEPADAGDGSDESEEGSGGEQPPPPPGASP